MKHVNYRNKKIILYNKDIPDEYLERIKSAKIVAWDIETSGLDWRTDRITHCQLYTPDSFVASIRIEDVLPKNLRDLLLNPSVKKVFYDAMFDLRFMSYHWKAVPSNIACTKISLKLLDFNKEGERSLKFRLSKYLGISIDKNDRLSNRLSGTLTEKQSCYAAKEVIYLLPLLEELERELLFRDLLELSRECFKYIPTRVQLDLIGYEDLYGY